MSLFIATGHGGGRVACTNPARSHPYSHHSHHHPQILLPLTPRRALHVIVSAKKVPSRTGRFDSRNRRSSITTKDDDEEVTGEKIDDSKNIENVNSSSSSSDDVEDNYYEMVAKLPGNEPDFWEGSQWDALGFFVQYLWAFGIVFALIACGIAVVTYNEGATDFKETPAYKESVQSRELLEEPDASNSEVFESNPTEVAPSLD